MRRRRTPALAAGLALAGLALGVGPALPSRADIANTLHNLTPAGPGTLKNPSPVGLCRFCHTPHRAFQTKALWNRDLQPQVYDPYASSTLEAAPGQPTGASRLCLSCHDGTVAIGNVRHAPGMTIDPLTPLEGRTRLGTDLRDDHPVSFVFDDALASRNGELASPLSLTGPVRLDRTGQVQCTSCHDPHEDRFPKFLVAGTESSELCTSCHQKAGWDGSSHAVSTAQWNGQGEAPWPPESFLTVGQNGCLSCHMPHAAARPERLLRRDPEEQVCLVCHNGNVAQTDVERHLQKPAHHPVLETSGTHDPVEDPFLMGRHAACTDCHNPHAVTPAAGNPPFLPGPQQEVSGIDSGGGEVEPAQYAYEVCFKCHGTSEAPSPRVIRQDPVTNVRLETHPANPSYHPVTAVGTNPSVVSLLPPLLPSSRIYCHDCHNTDEAVSPSLDTPNGPHGSLFEPILEREYPLHDNVLFSEADYALCFKCHAWDNGLRDTSAFVHKRHLENVDTSCAACHDPHGSRTSTHLINFLRFDENGIEVVKPSSSTGRLEFIDLGDGRGECYLTCHDVDHCPRSYVGPDKDLIADCP